MHGKQVNCAFKSRVVSAVWSQTISFRSNWSNELLTTHARVHYWASIEIIIIIKSRVTSRGQTTLSAVQQRTFQVWTWNESQKRWDISLTVLFFQWVKIVSFHCFNLTLLDSIGPKTVFFFAVSSFAKQTRKNLRFSNWNYLRGSMFFFLTFRIKPLRHVKRKHSMENLYDIVSGHAF